MSAGAPRRRWPDYSAIWRWHFYAGVLCIPFVIWLALTGSVYLFRPDIESLLDRPYENLKLDSARPLPSAEAAAAVNAIVGSQFSKYSPPATSTGAAQVVVLSNGELWRVYVDPRDLKPMKMLRDEWRPMEVIGRLHGTLLLGNAGSIMVEIAASWAIVLVITGLYLWFPRNRSGIAGVLYPRLSGRGRLFWRDLHAVTGCWVSAFVLFMLLSGLPWTFAWGSYLGWARELSTVTSGSPTWTVGGAAPREAALGSGADAPPAMAGMTATEMAAVSPPGSHTTGMSDSEHQAMLIRSLDIIVPATLALGVARPVLIQPPTGASGGWIVTSDNQNRLKRVTYVLANDDGSVISRSGFSDQKVVDRLVNIGISVHVGQLFGRINQAVLLFMATGLLTMMISAVVMWLRRRPRDLLGAPRPNAPPRAVGWLLVTIIGLALLMPLFGLTLLALLAAEHWVFRRVPPLRRWLGLAEPASGAVSK
jgi:uncharacterized iron-regulated membrane protein